MGLRLAEPGSAPCPAWSTLCAMRRIWFGLIFLGAAASAASGGCGDRAELLTSPLPWSGPGGSPAATCTDGVQNGDETDVDCGGLVCPGCADGERCAISRDCASSVCSDAACAPLDGCDPATATDLTGVPAVTVTFGGALGDAYSPSCIQVTVGTSVTFTGDFAADPLLGGEGGPTPLPALAGTTPLPTDAGGEATGTSQVFVMSPEGAYGYYSVAHGDAGMEGAIFVEPVRSSP